MDSWLEVLGGTGLTLLRWNVPTIAQGMTLVHACRILQSPYSYQSESIKLARWDKQELLEVGHVIDTETTVSTGSIAAPQALGSFLCSNNNFQKLHILPERQKIKKANKLQSLVITWRNQIADEGSVRRKPEA